MVFQTNFLPKINSIFWIFLIVSIVFSSGVTAICGANIEKIRKRRVEAIRGQILSKLGKTELPYNNETFSPPPLTKEIEEMYNRTREFVLEQARLKKQECSEPDESYFAKEITTINASEPPTSHSPGVRALNKYRNLKMKQRTSDFLYFDVEPLGLDPDSIASATLRFYQVSSPRSPNGRNQKVFLYQLSPSQMTDSSPQKNLVSMKTLDTYGEGWKSVDITSSFREWVRIPKLNYGLEITGTCEKDSEINGISISQEADEQQLDILIAGSSNSLRESQPRGDQQDQSIYQEFLEEHSPQVVIMSHSNQIQSHFRSSNRRKRSLDADFCFRRNPSEPNCCLRELFIDFRRDLGWSWIRTPSGYKANFCAGACPYLWSTDTQHSKILSLYQTTNPQASSAPCCTPKELEPIVIMYFEQGRYRITQLPDMVVTSCNCS